MKAEIVAVGTELLLGEIADTNTSFLARQLAALGIDLHYAHAIGDNRERLVATLRQAWQHAKIIITTGGLGPTQDDVTREAIAELLGEKPAVNDALKQDLIAFFRRRGIEMPENNLRQAMLLPSATAIPNRRGTAPGWWVEKEGKTIITLPGPPGELQAMWQAEVFPRLEKKSGAVILSRVVKTWGISEAKVDEMAAPLLSQINPTVATYAKPDGIHLRITAKADASPLAMEMLAGCEADLRKILGTSVWGRDEEMLEAVVGKLLVAQGLTLAVAETLTGGFLAYTLTSDPQSSRYFKGGIIMPRGSADAEGAHQLAATARAKFGADIGLSVTGATDPAGTVEVASVYVAIDDGKTRPYPGQPYSGRPHQIKRQAVQHALFDLYHLLCSRQSA
ncbi:CinA family nicotinamide mononucleotide deamidase-related protein [Chloroflexota bacterium]